MELLWSRAAIKDLRRMPRPVAEAFRAALQEIAAEPFGKHPNVTALQGFKDGFRLRRGDWRAVYRLDRDQKALIVERVRPRGDVY